MLATQIKRQKITVFIVATIIIISVFSVSVPALATAIAEQTTEISGTLESYDKGDGIQYHLKLDSLDSLSKAIPDASNVVNNILDLLNGTTKIDFSPYVGMRVTVVPESQNPFVPTRSSLGMYVAEIKAAGGTNSTTNLSQSSTSTPAQSAKATIEEANRVLSALDVLGDLHKWLESDESMIDRAMNYWCGGGSVPASVIEDNLRRYFGVESIDHSYFAAKDGGFGYSDGYYSYGGMGWMEYDWANVTKYQENGDGSITAQVTLYAVAMEQYDANGKYLGDTLPNFRNWYYKDSSEWEVPCEQYKSGFAEVVLTPIEYNGVLTWQIDSIDGVPSPRMLPTGVSMEILPIGNEFTFAATGSRYQLYDGKGISWQDAKAFCESSGGHLAVITSSEENKFIFDYITANSVKSAYFGLSDYNAEGDWKWVTNEPVSYVNWGQGEPNGENDNEDYAMFYWKYNDGTWNDGDFGGSTVNGGTVFICEWDGEALIDSDKDGLPDDWEINGVTINGVHLPLNEWGADPNKKDVFVEIDWMSGLKPSQTALNMVAKAFDNRGINLHIDFGADSVDYVTGKAWGSESGGSEIFYEQMFDFSQWISRANDMMQNKARLSVFHHCFYVNQFNSERNTGKGQTKGQAFIVALGVIRDAKNVVDVSKAEAGTFMHELGHNLGLEHGGDQSDDNANYKPNYLSVMNYSFQFNGLYPSGVLDYSNHKLPDLNENDLSEFDGVDPKSLTAGTGLGTIYYFKGEAKKYTSAIGKINWNQNKLWMGWVDWRDNIENSVSIDINTNDKNKPTGLSDKLTGFDDWYYLINADWGSFEVSGIGKLGDALSTVGIVETEYPDELTAEEVDALLAEIERAEVINNDAENDVEQKTTILFMVIVGIVVVGIGIAIVVIIRYKRRNTK